MKIYAIIDDDEKKELAYFIYYEKINECYIEIRDDVDEWDLPFILEHFVRNGKRTVDPYHTLLWLRQRVVPSDRQNIGMILKECGLETYDEIALFLIAEGRCSQDACYIKRIKNEQLPPEIVTRMSHRLISAMGYGQTDYLITFADGTVATIELSKYCEDYPWIKRMMGYAHSISEAKVVCGGSCISWSDKWKIPYDFLYTHAQRLPFSENVLHQFANQSRMTTQEVMALLKCTRQNVNDLVNRGKLVPIDTAGKNYQFYRKDVEALL